ncbi:transmembrane protein [Natrinema pellirubrum DSM 15624]|nr:hypothetical protein [Natrinema pellirubrum]ELY70474.1 transmembrane protein [Natrinema pellirubrum DSM 15624]
MALVIEGGTAELVARSDPTLPPLVGLFTTLLWLSSTALFGQRAAMRVDDIENASLLLTSTGPTAVTIGVLVGEYVRALAFALLPTGLLGLGFLSGADTYAPLVTVPLTVCLALLSSVCCGYAAGSGIALFSRRSKWKTSFVAGGIALVTVAGLVVAMSRLGTAPELAARLPPSWYGDLLAVGTPIEASPYRAVGAVLGTGVLVAACGSATKRTTTALWLDGRNATAYEDWSGGRTADESDDRLVSVASLAERVDRPTRCVACRSVRRAKRRPSRLSHLALPLLISAWLLVDLARIGDIESGFPIAVGLLGAWFVGGFLTLNPLGDDGAALPTTLASPLAGRQFVRGTALVSAVVGIPLLVGSVAGSGVAAYSLPVSVGLAVWAGVHGSTAIAIGLAVGMVFPRFGAVRIGRRRDIVPPSLTALAIYSTIVFAFGVGGVVAVLGPWILFEGDPTTVSMFAGLSTLVWLSIEAGVGYGCYRIAVRCFDRYTLD